MDIKCYIMCSLIKNVFITTIVVVVFSKWVMTENTKNDDVRKPPRERVKAEGPSIEADIVRSYKAILEAGSQAGWAAYLGCYGLASNDTKSLKAQKEDVDVKACITHCWIGRKKFALMERGRVCSCTDILRGIVRTGENECETPCVVNKTQACGGMGKFDTYYTGYIEEPHYTHITSEKIKAAYDGCYRDPAYKVMCSYRVESPRMRVAMCMSICEDELFPLAALGNPKSCCCALSKDGTHQVRQGLCPLRCAEQKSLKCGGKKEYLSVYRTGVTEILGKRKKTTPKDLLWMSPHINETIIKVV